MPYSLPVTQPHGSLGVTETILSFCSTISSGWSDMSSLSLLQYVSLTNSCKKAKWCDTWRWHLKAKLSMQQALTAILTNKYMALVDATCLLPASAQCMHKSTSGNPQAQKCLRWCNAFAKMPKPNSRIWLTTSYKRCSRMNWVLAMMIGRSCRHNQNWG